MISYTTKVFIKNSKNLSWAISGSADVQKELAIYDELKRDGKTFADRGLLISGYTPDEFNNFISNDGMLVVGYENEGKVDGYLLVDPGRKFTAQLKNAKISWYSDQFRQSISPTIDSGEYEYLDQIGVRFSHHGKGLANELLKTAEDNMRKKVVIVLIMTKPITNSASISFFLKNNYTPFSDVYFEKYGTMSPFEGIMLIKT